MQLWAAFVLAASGAAVTYWAVRRTQQLADESERRRMRRDVLRKLVGTRHMIVQGAPPGTGEFWGALNEVVVLAVHLMGPTGLVSGVARGDAFAIDNRALP